jgi:tetratricopeptide (TPR) repeat protein
LAVIIIIVVRKFSILANLDVDSIPAEREARFKQQIISNRLKRNLVKYQSRAKRGLEPVLANIQKLGGSLMGKLKEIKDGDEEDMSEPDSEDAVNKLFSEAEACFRDWELEEAEKKYIKIISLDSGSVRAFRGLGRVYLEQKNYTEAKQTLEHAVRLIEKNGEKAFQAQPDKEEQDKKVWLAGTFLDLALVAKEQGDAQEADLCINRALEIEPNNPRFLDTKLELSIMNKDKAGAEEVFARLAEANPENQKLEILKKQIEEIDGGSQ